MNPPVNALRDALQGQLADRAVRGNGPTTRAVNGVSGAHSGSPACCDLRAVCPAEQGGKPVIRCAAEVLDQDLLTNASVNALRDAVQGQGRSSVRREAGPPTAETDRAFQGQHTAASRLW
jgi:hypothetical protein